MNELAVIHNPIWHIGFFCGSLFLGFLFYVVDGALDVWRISSWRCANILRYVLVQVCTSMEIDNV